MKKPRSGNGRGKLIAWGLRLNQPYWKRTSKIYVAYLGLEYVKRREEMSKTKDVQFAWKMDTRYWQRCEAKMRFLGSNYIVWDSRVGLEME